MYKFFMVFILIIAAGANAQTQKHNHKLYVRADIGGFNPIDKFQEDDNDLYITKRPRRGMIYNVGLGYVINNMWRGDLNFNYRSLYYKAREFVDGLDTARQRARIYSGFLNGYFDLNFHKIIKPYLGAGLGYSHNSNSNLSFKMDVPGGEIEPDKIPGKKTGNFAWNIGAGIRFCFTSIFNLDLSYKYVDLGKVRTAAPIETPNKIPRQFKIRFHDITGGIIIFL